MDRDTKIRITKVLRPRKRQAFKVGDVLGVSNQWKNCGKKFLCVQRKDGAYRIISSMMYEWDFITCKLSQEELLDKAEEAALKRVEQAAYECTERVAPNVQKKLFDNLYSYMSTGVRLMREEISNIKK